MLSAKIHAAALAHARLLTTDHSEAALTPLVDTYETAYHRGFHDRPKAANFPLSGQRAFLRVLAPYLAEGIDIYHPATGRYGKLKGLPATYEGQGEPLADVEFYADADAREEGGGDINEPASKILPVLYGFEDLATELTLADGRRVVPAVEVAKLGGGHDNIDGAELMPGVNGLTIISLTAYGRHMWSLWPHDFIKGDVGYHLAEINWLRQHHFAVGLRPEQYHRKVVAVAKEFDACSNDCHKCGATDWSRKGPDNCNKCEVAPATKPHNCELGGCAILVDELGPCVGCAGKEVCPNA